MAMNNEVYAYSREQLLSVRQQMIARGQLDEVPQQNRVQQGPVFQVNAQQRRALGEGWKQQQGRPGR